MSKYGQITSDDPLTHFAIAAMIMRGAVEPMGSSLPGRRRGYSEDHPLGRETGMLGLFAFPSQCAGGGDDWVDESDTFRNEGSLRGFAWALLTSFLHSYSYLRVAASR